jgi:UDP-N-acetylmuramate--alanine ligase
MYTKALHFHFVGIGGIGMSGIATILQKQGYTVSGCDSDVSQTSITRLQQLGCVIAHGHNSPFCRAAPIDFLVHSSIIKATHPELVFARTRNIPIITRAQMLAELMRTKYSIAVTGSHGKTTTTSLIADILLQAQQDPTIIVGGYMGSTASNVHLGVGDLLVAEADESDRSLLVLPATLAVITNIDLEHLETYADLDDIKRTFKQFLCNVPFYGRAFLCTDSEPLRSLLPIPSLSIVTYGIEHPAALTARNLILNETHSLFDVWDNTNHSTLGSIQLALAGKHNVLNALGAIAVARELGIPFEIIQMALSNFKGVDRRFSYRGIYRGAEVFDDYGHHPEEIYNTLLVAQKRKKNKLIVLFQPHRYTRTHKLWDEFIKAFAHSRIDHLFITDIFSMNEEPIEHRDSQQLVRDLQQSSFKGTISYVPYEHNFSSIKKDLIPLLGPNDLLLLLGAGKVNQIIHHIDITP